MTDVSALMGRLATERPVFHSEADFQHSFAWCLHRAHPGSNLRLERPIEVDGYRATVDLVAWTSEGSDWFELKYPTKQGRFVVQDEGFELKTHSAADVGRYGLWEDVVRLEHFVRSTPLMPAVGHAVFLTNDETYWLSPGRGRALDEDFRFREGRLFEGELTWPQPPGAKLEWPWERRRDASFLQLRGKYRIEWRDYSRVSDLAGGRLRYFVVSTPFPG